MHRLFGPIVVALTVLGCDAGEPDPPEHPNWIGAADLVRLSLDSLEACSSPGSVAWTHQSDALSVVLGARLGPTGEVVIADRLAGAVLVFAGDTVRRIGRRGDGPGEFSGVADVRFAGDTLLVWDANRGSVSAFGLSGRFHWTEKIQPQMTAQRQMGFVGRDRHGRYPFIARPFGGRDRPNTYQDTSEVVFLDSESVNMTPPIRVPAAWKFVETTGSARITLSFLLSGQVFVEVVDGETWIISGASGALARVDGAGRLDVARAAAAARIVTPDMIAVERNRLRRSISTSRAPGSELSGAANSVPAAETSPVFDNVLGTTSGELWLAEFSADEDSSRVHWVLDSAGDLVRCVHVQERWRVLDARNDRVLVSTTDELGVPRLEIRMLPPAKG